jgi:hypothetical protein
MVHRFVEVMQVHGIMSARIAGIGVWTTALFAFLSENWDSISHLRTIWQ